jgi:hypothetical protein
LYQVVTTARDGSFRLPVNAGEGRSVPPGEYKVFAWESVPTNAWHNEAFMAQYETRGIPVDVKAGDKTVLQLVAIPESDR